jgi:hypothetical protein
MTKGKMVPPVLQGWDMPKENPGVWGKAPGTKKNSYRGASGGPPPV